MGLRASPSTVAFHVRHIARSRDCRFTYARKAAHSPTQVGAVREESKPSGLYAAEVADVALAAIDRALLHVHEWSERTEELNEARGGGMPPDA